MSEILILSIIPVTYILNNYFIWKCKIHIRIFVITLSRKLKGRRLI